MTTTTDPLRAAIWMTGAIASFSLMAVAGRAISFELDTFEIMMYRSFVGFVIVLVFALFQAKTSEFRTARMPLHIGRNIAHFIGQNLWFFALTAIPLAQVFALEFTTPLWVILFSPFLLGERLTRLRILAAVLGFIGILIVTRPSPDTMNIGTLAAALSAIGFALTAICTKRLTHTESLTNILFWMTVIQAGFGILCAGADGDIALPSKTALPWLISIGLCGLLAHLCITKALTMAPASVVIPIDFARLPVIAVVGMLLYNEPLDLLVFFGAAIIFAANYLNIRQESSITR